MVCIGIFSQLPLCAQAPVDSFPHDPSYYKTYEGFLAGRVYLSRKYTTLLMKSRQAPEASFRYRPNSDLTLGVGGTYNWLTINLGFGFDFLNQHRSNRGETKYFDLQTHLYGRRVLLLLYAQRYEGFFISETDKQPLPEPYLKGDLATTQLGFSYQYMLNWKRFSARAAMLQSERQLKPAGTLLAGVNMNYVNAHADSSIVPSLPGYENLSPLSRLFTVEFGPSLGYAYNYVFLERVFLMGMLTGHLNMNYVAEYTPTGKNTRFGLNPDLSYKLAAGFSQKRWSIAFTWTDARLFFKSQHYNNSLGAGSFRLAWVYRFIAGPKLLKTMEPVDRIYYKGYERYKRLSSKLKPSSLLK